jgi:hypothetical protein
MILDDVGEIITNKSEGEGGVDEHGDDDDEVEQVDQGGINLVAMRVFSAPNLRRT